MKCPACDRQLSKLNINAVELDVCEGGCGGIWFDDMEIKGFDEPKEFGDGALFKVSRNPNVTIDSKKLRHCPRCSGEVLVRQFYDTKNQVEIDQCWNCSGIWLDVGELEAIRGQYRTEEERAMAIGRYADQCLEGHLTAIKEAKLTKPSGESTNAFTEFVKTFKQLVR